MAEMSCKRKDRPKTSLLEDLRNKLVAESIIHPTTKENARQKFDLIVSHQSEFPLKLRVAIEDASSGEASQSWQLHNPLAESPSISRRRRDTRKHHCVDPEVFLHRVYEAVKVFFLGVLYRATGTDQQHHWLLGWYGLDHAVDTEDEAELTIRCFPQILTQTTHLERTGLHHALPIHMLLSDSRTVSFVPLFCRLGKELGTFPTMGGPKHLSVVGQLLCNTIAATAEASRAQFCGRKPNTDEVDRASLKVLVQLRESGLVTRNDIHNSDLVIDLLDAASYREATFIEERLRFLIDWNPNVLKECEGGLNLLYTSCVWNNFHHKQRFCREGVEVRMFETIFAGGMKYFPLEVGFLFHKDIFKLGCQRMGSKIVKEMVRDKLLGTLGKTANDKNEQQQEGGKKNITLQELVVAAASNEEISLDGIYTLVRFDPTQALTRC